MTASAGTAGASREMQSGGGGEKGGEGHSCGEVSGDKRVRRRHGADAGAYMPCSPAHNSMMR